MADAVRKATLRVRADMLRDYVKRQKKLEAIYGKRLEALQRKLRKSGVNISATIEREMRKLTEEVAPLVKESIQAGTASGVATAEAQFQAAFVDTALPKFPTTAEQMALAGQRIRGKMYVDKIPLSKRLWANSQATGRSMAVQIQKSIRAGDGMESIAKQIVAKNPPAVSMPKYIADIRDAAKQAAELGQPNLLDDAVLKYQKQIDKLGSRAGPLFDARANTRKFITDIRAATPKQIDEHARRYMTEKARQHAVTIARTETIHAYRDGFYKSVKGKPWVKGIRWNLAGSHPKADICDVYASQDVDGLGPGGYEEGNIPSNPHPNCMCYQTPIVDRHHFRRQVAKRDGKKAPPVTWKSGKKQTGSQWLRTQPKRVQRELLGPTRAEMLDKAPNKVMDPKTGNITRVRDLDKK